MSAPFITDCVSLALTQGCWRSVPRPGAARFDSLDRVDSNRRIVCAIQRAICSRHLVPLGGHLALIARCKWRDENVKHSNLVPLRATTSQLGGSLSPYTPLGTLLATLGATVNCEMAQTGTNWRWPSGLLA